jgi:hypothetical protein
VRGFEKKVLKLMFGLDECRLCYCDVYLLRMILLRQ